MRDFSYLKVGDPVIRLLGGEVEMPLRVTEIKKKEGIIVCQAWEFDVITGAEIDEELEWGPKFGASGSFLLHPKIKVEVKLEIRD